jgi:hypothetical protein
MLEKKPSQWGLDRPKVFIKKKKPSPGLENPPNPSFTGEGIF